MPKGYQHLTYEQRCQIYTLKKSGLSIPKISAQIEVDRSTLYRELKRNSGSRGYRYKQANTLSVVRKQTASLKANRKLTPNRVQAIEELLTLYQWSPEQISGYLKKETEFSISHESIYQHIWKDKRNGGRLYKHLRHRAKKYNKRSAQGAGRGLIPNRVDIEERPEIVEEKARIGDWEIDTIIGKEHIGAIVSMVDRRSKLTKLALVKDKKAATVGEALCGTLLPFKDWVLTLTADNGKEFAGHRQIASRLEADVYFARPYHSWERGLNEHTNGLVRQYFPKGTRFDTLTDEDVQEVEDLLNHRPRKILGFKMPVEVFAQATDP